MLRLLAECGSHKEERFAALSGLQLVATMLALKKSINARMFHELLVQAASVRLKLTLGQSQSHFATFCQSVGLGVEPHLGLMTRCL
jgi:hypothetical protein